MRRCVRVDDLGEAPGGNAQRVNRVGPGLQPAQLAVAGGIGRGPLATQ